MFNQSTLEDIGEQLEGVLEDASNLLSCVYGDALNIKLYIAHKQISAFLDFYQKKILKNDDLKIEFVLLDQCAEQL